MEGWLLEAWKRGGVEAWGLAAEVRAAVGGEDMKDGGVEAWGLAAEVRAAVGGEDMKDGGVEAWGTRAGQCPATSAARQSARIDARAIPLPSHPATSASPQAMPSSASRKSARIDARAIPLPSHPATPASPQAMPSSASRQSARIDARAIPAGGTPPHPKGNTMKQQNSASPKLRHFETAKPQGPEAAKSSGLARGEAGRQGTIPPARMRGRAPLVRALLGVCRGRAPVSSSWARKRLPWLPKAALMRGAAASNQPDAKHPSTAISQSANQPFLRLAAIPLLLLFAVPVWGVEFRVQSEAQVTLSLAQEADEAIDRAQRWLREQPPATNDVARLLLRRYALAAPGQPLTLTRCDLTPLEQAMPPPLAPDAMTNLTAAIALRRDSPKDLFALQRDLITSPTLPPDWRQRLVTHLINTQHIDSHGGHWGTPEATTWAILALRALLNESTPITLR